MNPIVLPDHIIELERKPFRLQNQLSGNSCRYICSFHFKNKIGINLLDIVVSEGDIVHLTESIYEYLEFNSRRNCIYMNSSSSNLNSFGFEIKEMPNNCDCLVTVVEYNPYIDYRSERLKFILGDSVHYDLTDFILDIHQAFLSDIPDLTYLNPDFLC